MTIPATAHFVWFGAELPWVYALALRSAAIRGELSRVVLHHEPALRESAVWPELEAIDGFEGRELSPEDVLAACPQGGPLVDLYRLLRQPAARANMTRAAILFTEGGVYLDTDTITVATLTPLREEAAVFCGEEHVVFPAAVRRSRNPLRRGLAVARSALRSALREAPEGWRAFRTVDGFYPRAVNNAVLASEPGHPFVEGLLRRMVAVPEERRLVRFALGTHLLQEAVADYGRADLVVHPPAVFYPLGPEISTHWFRELSRAPALERALLPDTRVVHWYASVRTAHLLGQIDSNYVRDHAGRQLFSALASPFV